MKNIFAFYCLYLTSLTSCSTLGSDESSIKALISAWSHVNPNTLGGPSELKNVSQVNEIKVINLHGSKFAKLGCKDCKEAEVELNCTTTDNKTKNILYQVRNFDGQWEITAWEVVGGEKGGCYPFINMEVVEARKSLKQ